MCLGNQAVGDRPGIFTGQAHEGPCLLSLLYPAPSARGRQSLVCSAVLGPGSTHICFLLLCPLASPLLSEDSFGKAERGHTAEGDSGSSGGSQLSEDNLGRCHPPHQAGDLSCDAFISPSAPVCRGKDRWHFLHRNVLTDCFLGTTLPGSMFRSKAHRVHPSFSLALAWGPSPSERKHTGAS